MQTYNEVPMLFQVGHPDIVQRMDVRGLVATAFMIFVGIVFLISISTFEDPSSSLSLFLLVAGVSLILVALSRLLCRTRCSVYQPTGSPLVERTYFFPMKHLPVLKALVARGCDGISCSSLHATPGGSVRLDVLQSRDHSFVALQLFEFIPYSYTPLAPPSYFQGSQAADLAALLRKL